MTIPEGGDIYIDPVGLTVTPGEELAVSIYLANGSEEQPRPPEYLVEHTLLLGLHRVRHRRQQDDQTGDTTGRRSPAPARSKATSATS